MIKFKKISIQNFLSFGEIPIEFRLNRDGTTLICGENGAGKSTLINAIVYTIYGKPLSSGTTMKVDSLINNINKKRMLTKIEFEKDGHTYLVERGRKMDGATSTFVNVFKDEKDVGVAGAVNGTKLVESIIGIPYELFIRIVTISSTYQSFLELPAKSASGGNQTDIIEELFSLKSLSEKGERLKEQIKKTKHSTDIQIAKKEALESERKRHTEQVLSAEKRMTRWIESNKITLEDLKNKLIVVNAIDIDTEKKFFEKIDKLTKNLSEHKPSQKDLIKLSNDLKAELKDVKNELTHLDRGQCPYCKQEMVDVTNKVDECNKIIKESNKLITKYKKQIDLVDKKINAINQEIDQLESKTSVNSIEDLFDIKNKIEKYSDQITKLESEDNPHEEVLDELLSVKISDYDNATINELDDLLKHQQMVLKLLTNKNSFIRIAMIKKNIPALNKRLNHYLYELGLTQIIEFSEDMGVTISQFGRKLDYSNLSKGQKARVNLALSFAFRDILQNLHGSINLMFLDEIFDGLDTGGIEQTAEMMNRKAHDDGTNIFLIAHNSEVMNSFDNKINIVMEDSFSYINY